MFKILYNLSYFIPHVSDTSVFAKTLHFHLVSLFVVVGLLFEVSEIFQKDTVSLCIFFIFILFFKLILSIQDGTNCFAPNHCCEIVWYLHRKKMDLF